MSPVYKIQLWSQEILSQACKKGGKKPIWTQKLVVKRKKGANVLKIEVWDENKYSDKDMIGSNYISLDTYDFLKNQNFSDWLELLYDNKKSGRIFISFKFSD